MKKGKRIFNIIVVSLILIEGLFVFLSYKSFNARKDDIENVNLIDDGKVEKNNMFAIMLQQEDGTYIESTSSSWPIDMKYNEELSGCIDKGGTELAGILTFDSTNNVATVTTSKTSYCYLYFDIGTTDTEKLIENVSSSVLWESTLEDDGYRFVGTNPDNYICFGTTNISTCTGNTDLYMYRIIGIFEGTDGEQHLKLIKKEALNTSYAWNADYENDVAWNASDIYNGLNGSYFLNNTTYSYMQNSTWTNKIATWDYTATNTKTYESSGMNYYSSVVRQTYLHEMNRSTKTSTVGVWNTVPAKIGLMYVSDYQLSLGSTALDYTNSNSTHYASMKTGWMHISNNDSGAPSQYEWTMSRYGDDFGLCYAWDVYSDGVVGIGDVDGDYHSVRPVFYLTSDVKISGEGTSGSPYIIS